MDSIENMNAGCIRFSRDLRFPFGHVTFQEFDRIAKELAALVEETRPSLNITILTCEDEETYNYSTVACLGEEEVEEILRRDQRVYTLDQFGECVWERSFEVSLVVTDESAADSISIRVTCDQLADTRILFSGEHIDPYLRKRIIESFKRPSFSYVVGDGIPKCSTFNILYSRKLYLRRQSKE